MILGDFSSSPICLVGYFLLVGGGCCDGVVLGSDFTVVVVYGGRIAVVYSGSLWLLVL